jgi:hypothetical protein
MPVRLFVGNLPTMPPNRSCASTSGAIGQLSSVFLPVDRETGRPRGFAFVEFVERGPAEDAVTRLNNQSLSAGGTLGERGAPVRIAVRPAHGPPASAAHDRVAPAAASRVHARAAASAVRGRVGRWARGPAAQAGRAGSAHRPPRDAHAISVPTPRGEGRPSPRARGVTKGRVVRFHPRWRSDLRRGRSGRGCGGRARRRSRHRRQDDDRGSHPSARGPAAWPTARAGRA